ncbi:hypothetical protein EYC80_006986 [Monilinia laxa]|uniref:Carrier domain-containing protein n=1 Tax=Monilinia laxa TaxID=61186 RepID=A0A5N6JZU2_MONLA|nr:hypothetical protein EYC80_006986 [Monilinia laxa]
MNNHIINTTECCFEARGFEVVHIWFNSRVDSKKPEEKKYVASFWIEEKLGTGENFQCIAYIGPHDLRYILLTIAAIKTGHKWDYFDFSTEFGAEMRHYSDELYEIVIVRDPSIEAYQGVFYTFPGLSEYKTRDLFSKHPTKDNLWRHKGRSDDIIVYSSGEKFNPISMESHLGSYPEVKAAVGNGDKKFQPALLIETVEAEKSKEAILDNYGLQYKVRMQNLPPTHGLYEEKYTGNTTNGHTMNGHATNENDHNPGGTNDDLQDITIQALESLQGFEEISPTENWFELGMDSLGVISLARALNVALRSHNPPQKSVSDSMIYAYPSPEKLASALSGAGKGKNESQDEMKKEYERYSFDLPIVARPFTPIRGSKVFLFTGSTGYLGSYILNSLLEEDETCKIYCLNRGEDSEERQRSSSSSKGLPADFKRVELLSMATGTEEPWLGMKIVQYKMLLDEVTHIIHNAWHVGFIVSLEPLGATHIRRVRQLIDFPAHSRHGCSIHFISSISSVGNWDIACNFPQRRVPEASFGDWPIPQGSGYGQAKYVAERVLATASSVADIPVSI